MSGKRVLIRFLMLLVLWGSLFVMFAVTKEINPWLRVGLGLALCIAYTVIQMKINRKLYGGQNGNPDVPTVDKDSNDEE